MLCIISSKLTCSIYPTVYGTPVAEIASRCLLTIECRTFSNPVPFPVLLFKNVILSPFGRPWPCRQ